MKTFLKPLQIPTLVRDASCSSLDSNADMTIRAVNKRALNQFPPSFLLKTKSETREEVCRLIATLYNRELNANRKITRVQCESVKLKKIEYSVIVVWWCLSLVRLYLLSIKKGTVFECT